MVKRHASDANLAQEVQLAVPYNRILRLSPLPTSLKPFKQIPSERKKNWLELAKFVLAQRCTLDVVRTARFLLNMVNEPNPSTFVPLPWLESGSNLIDGPAQLPQLLGRLAPAVRFKATIRA